MTSRNAHLDLLHYPTPGRGELTLTNAATVLDTWTGSHRPAATPAPCTTSAT